MSTRFDEYLNRPEELKQLTYPEFFKWWRKTQSDENKKGETQSADGNVPFLRCRATNDDFSEFVVAKQIKQNAIDQLALALRLARDHIPDDGEHAMLVLRCIKYAGHTVTVVNLSSNTKGMLFL